MTIHSSSVPSLPVTLNLKVVPLVTSDSLRLRVVLFIYIS